MHTGWVYFISWSDSSPVKIGYSTNPDSRLKTLQTSHPYKLTIEGVYPADERLERDLHLRFRRSRLEGEWFKRGKKLNQLIADSEQKWWHIDWRDWMPTDAVMQVEDDSQSGLRKFIVKDKRDGFVLLKTRRGEVAEQYMEFVSGRSRTAAVKGAHALIARGLVETESPWLTFA